MIKPPSHADSKVAVGNADLRSLVINKYNMLVHKLRTNVVEHLSARHFDHEGAQLCFNALFLIYERSKNEFVFYYVSA